MIKVGSTFVHQNMLIDNYSIYNCACMVLYIKGICGICNVRLLYSKYLPFLCFHYMCIHVCNHPNFYFVKTGVGSSINHKYV